MERYLVLAVLPLVLAVPASASGDVLVENDRRYVGSDGELHIVGEVQNNLEYTVGQVSVRATLFSGDGGVAGEAEVGSMIRTLSPGMRAPFDIVVLDGGLRDAAAYGLDLDYEVSVPKSQVIDIVDSELKRDGLGNLVIAGTVANRGDITANTVSVVATLYDRGGDVVAASRLHTEPDYLRSGDVARFIVPILDETQAGAVADYALLAESEEYAAVPEFPIGSGLLLAGSVGAYVVLTRFPNRFIANLALAGDPR